MWEVNPLAGSIDSVIGFIQSREPARERAREREDSFPPSVSKSSSSFLLVPSARQVLPIPCPPSLRLASSVFRRFRSPLFPRFVYLLLTRSSSIFLFCCRQWRRIRSRTLLPVSLLDLLRALSFPSFSFGLTSVSVVDGVLSRSAARASAFCCCCVWRSDRYGIGEAFVCRVRRAYDLGGVRCRIPKAIELAA